MKRITLVALTLIVAACSRAPNSDGADHALVSDSAAAPQGGDAKAEKPSGNQPGPIAVSVPQIAYDYKYAYRVPGAAIAKVQAGHVSLCDRVGPQRCQVTASEQSGGDDASATGHLTLRVASSIARTFGVRLQQVVASSGGRAVSSSVTGEDVSKDISDTSARLAQRELLVQRLTDVLRDRQGSVADLVAAERSVADAQEEVDQARAWLTQLQARVALSTIDIDYQSVAAAPGSAGSGLGEAAQQSWSAFVIGLLALLRLAIILLPWAILGGIGYWTWRKLAPRFRARAPDHSE